jgi:hypothetical protein
MFQEQHAVMKCNVLLFMVSMVHAVSWLSDGSFNSQTKKLIGLQLRLEKWQIVMGEKMYSGVES